MFTEFFLTFIASLSPRDVVGPLIAGFGGYFAALRVTRSNEKIAREKLAEETEKLAQDLAKEHATERVADSVATEDNVTRRLIALMEGYEARVKDLTAEVNRLRGELGSLRRVLDDRAIVCIGCPRLKLAYRGADNGPDAGPYTGST